MSGFIVSLEDNSQVSEARRHVRQLAATLGFDEQAAEKAALVITEASTNLLKHASGGKVIARAGEVKHHTHADTFLEILALDQGPGIEDFERCLQDGFSTTGTPGNGLGAIARLSAYCEVYSQPGRGTALLARISAPAAPIREPSHIGAVQVLKRGEDVCGDQWGIVGTDGRRMLLLADGLGHGPDAARASHAAVDALHHAPDASPGETIDNVHAALRHTRGAAVAVAEVDFERRIVTFAGLGNINGTVCAPGEPVRRMVSTNGTAGMEARHIREFTYPWPDNAVLVMHSDGLSTHWNLSDYPSLLSHDPGLIAGVLYRDFSRGTDDATIVVVK